MNKRRSIMVLMISLSLVLLLGSSYALLRSTQVGSIPYVINVGSLQVTFDNEQTDALELENMYPMSDKEGSSQSNELGFTVKNTGTVASYYDITLEETSVSPEFKSVIRFISNKNSQGYNEPKTLSEDKYIDVGGYLDSDAKSSYKVKVWLDYNADETYMDKTFTAKVVINSFQESSYAKDVIKSKLVKYEESSKDTFTGGLVAVNIDGDLYNETAEGQQIREYRFSGPSVNNYVTFNDELWRIVGVFKDEVGEEQVKIVRNEILSTDELPVNYIYENVSYDMLSNQRKTTYFNKKTLRQNEINDWATAGLQYFLNSEHDDNNTLGYLSDFDKDSKEMIAKIKYYLGTVVYNQVEEKYGIEDSTKTTYLKERMVNGCIDNKGVSTNINQDAIRANNTCRVWNNNAAVWEGLIGLLYPSDYGYSVNKAYWDSPMWFGSYNGTTSNTSWMYKNANHQGNEWLISPMDNSKGAISDWSMGGHLTSAAVYADNECNVRPTLYLKSNVKITGGIGEESTPYILSLDNY